MPEPEGTVSAVRERALVESDLYLTNRCGALRLSETAFKRKGAYKAGWSLSLPTLCRDREFHVYVDSSFPFSLPSIYLIDRPPFLTWPHIEEDGKLCLLDDIKIRRPESAPGILASQIADAVDLIRAAEAGNQEDFRSEFHSYWNRQPNLSSKRVLSLIDPHGPSRLIRVWFGRQFCVAGETESQVLNWIRHRYEKTDARQTEIGCLLWLETALLPTQYPRSGSDLYTLIRTRLNDTLLRSFIGRDKDRFLLLLAADTINGPCLGGIRYDRPSQKSNRCSVPGFRQGNAPAVLEDRHLFSPATKVQPMEVDRVDAEWIHGRGHDPRQSTLKDKHVILAGCGSVGAPIAQQLAMAGVGGLTLVDPKTLSWSNVGRHPLGARFVDKSKSLELAKFLQENYPHHRIEGFIGNLQKFLAENAGASTADLIICATADWNMERVLNLEHVHGVITTPVLYAWTEPHACAGHALFLRGTRPCLQCGFTLGGEMKHPVTKWPSGAPHHRSEPACGALFQPYGPIELMGTVSVASSLALDALLGNTASATHRIWAGSRTLLHQAHGDWSDDWLQEHPDRIGGAFQEDSDWINDDSCLACGPHTHLSGSPSDIPGKSS
jgi:molybdopterin/thiamine biosynthesis adenylyltransferase